MSISTILVFFLNHLSVGMIATVALIPTSIVDRRFFKSISFWALLFAGAALYLEKHSTFVLAGPFSPSPSEWGLWSGRLFLLFGGMTLLFWFLLRFLNQPPRRVFLVPIALVGLTAVCLDALLYRPSTGPLWIHNLLMPMNSLSSAMILGGFLAGMIFGHWFLVNTEMPKRLLTTMAWILIGVLALRIGVIATSLGLTRGLIYPDTPFLSNLVSFKGHGIFFWERVLIGLLIPAGVTALIYNTARIGSNQSATGIMYVGIAFVFIGELVAKYLFLLSGVPL